jgi:hypothetical protein
VAEGLQSIPALADQDEELAAKRELRPLTLEEARLRIQKTRDDLNKPHFTTHGMYERDPATGKYTYTQTDEQKKTSAKEAEMGLLAQWGDYPEGSPQRRFYEARLAQLTGTREAKTPYTAQLWQKYYRGETSEAEEMILKQELAKSFKPVPESGRVGSTLPSVELPPRPGGGAPAPTTEAAPPVSQAVPAPGSTAPAPSQGTSPTTTLSAAENAMANKYAKWFHDAGEQYATQTMEGMRQGNHPNTRAAYLGFTRAYPGGSAPASPGAPGTPPVTAPQATPAPQGPGPSPAYQARQEQARLRQEQAQLKIAGDPRNVQARALFATGGVPSPLYLANPPEAQARIDQAVLEAKTEEAARKPLRSAERTSFVNPETLTTPAVQTWAEARAKGLILLAKEDAASVRLGNVLYSKLNRAQETLERLVETDPAWQALKGVTGLGARGREAALLGAQNSMQVNPLVRQLQSDLSEMGISYGMFVSGLKGRPAERILERTTAGLPGLDVRLFHAGGSNWLQTALNLVSTGRLPDLPRTITAQLEMMKDVTRTVQESFLESAGAMTADVAAERRLTRMQRILELTRGEAPAPAPTPTLAPGARTTGPEVLPEALKETLPELWKALTP